MFIHPKGREHLDNLLIDINERLKNHEQSSMFIWASQAVVERTEKLEDLIEAFHWVYQRLDEVKTCTDLPISKITTILYELISVPKVVNIQPNYLEKDFKKILDFLIPIAFLTFLFEIEEFDNSLSNIKLFGIVMKCMKKSTLIELLKLQDLDKEKIVIQDNNIIVLFEAINRKTQNFDTLIVFDNIWTSLQSWARLPSKKEIFIDPFIGDKKQQEVAYIDHAISRIKPPNVKFYFSEVRYTLDKLKITSERIVNLSQKFPLFFKK